VDAQRPDPILIRWISSKEGSRIAVPEEILEGPTGAVFGPPAGASLPRDKLIQEVS